VVQLYSFFNLWARQGGWSISHPSSFIHWKGTRYHCGHQNRSGRVRKISPLPRFDAQTVGPVASRYAGPLPQHLIEITSLDR
jgi:hypothetical protein